MIDECLHKLLLALPGGIASGRAVRPSEPARRKLRNKGWAAGTPARLVGMPAGLVGMPAGFAGAGT